LRLIQIQVDLALDDRIHFGGREQPGVLSRTDQLRVFHHQVAELEFRTVANQRQQGAPLLAAARFGKQILKTLTQNTAIAGLVQNFGVTAAIRIDYGLVEVDLEIDIGRLKRADAARGNRRKQESEK